MPAFEDLKKILRQEAKLGHQNRAVIGGLERYANTWLQKALQEAQNRDERLKIEQVVVSLKAYGDLKTSEARQNALTQIFTQLDEPAPPDASAPSPPQPTPAKKKTASPKTRPASSSAALPATDNSGLQSPVTRLPGIKSGNAAKLARLGVYQIGDLLTLYPHRYDDYRALKTINQLEYNEDVTIIVQVWQTKVRKTRNNRPLVTSTLSDGTGTIEATWFNQPWLEQKLTPGTQIVLSGRVSQYLGRLTFQAPDWEPLDKTQVHTGRLVPVYPLTNGVTAKWLRDLQKKTIDYWAPRLQEYLPADSLARQNLMPLREAIQQIHFPDDWEQLEQARHRLAFDELLFIQLGVLRQRQRWKAQTGQAIAVNSNYIERFLGRLPYKLTRAQQQALNEILADMENSSPMSRLLQGDVGSGKTVVALAAMLAAVQAGSQTTILAPTEILAEQHFNGIQSLLEQTDLATDVRLALLTGTTTTRERDALLADLAAGQIHILVGTHAIIQEDVQFDKLALAVVDEQHRFGVQQRSLLRNKGINPHMLVMSATPIPRSLALTLYGDLDLSIIDELPPGRQTIKTAWLGPHERERAYTFIRSQIEQGRQAFIICPLVEESDKIEAKSAIAEHKRLQKDVFPQLKLGLLHGRMKGAEKDTVMTDFRDQSYDLLVSTAVVEVGIDIPNASVILIEGANRFGLAQLHQFRGRVGRGSHRSYCLLLSDNDTAEAQARLSVLEKTSNGFELAEQDLKLRGPGEFFGTRQSGLPSLKLVRLSDRQLLEQARAEAKHIFDQDPGLDQTEHATLAEHVTRLWSQASEPN